jgi:hypothetical protein
MSSPNSAASASVWSLENDRCAYFGVVGTRWAEVHRYLEVDQRLKRRYVDSCVIIVRVELT